MTYPVDEPMGQPTTSGAAGPAASRLPMPSVPMPRVALPVQEREYHHFWRTPLLRWWRPVLAVVLGVFIFLVLTVLASMVAVGLDMATGRTDVSDLQTSSDSITVTPALFLANNISLALLIPLSMLLSAWLFKQRRGWLASVTGRMRWGWMGRCFLALTPLWVLYLGFDLWMTVRSGQDLGLHVNKDTWLLLVGILLTTPFQAAGEEYAFRGLLNRSAASLVPHRTVALVVGAVFSSGLFMLAHGAGDVWLNIFYFCFGMIACGMTWRTGGIEAAIAMHVINNVLSELVMPFSDISGIFDRQAGTADATVLVGVIVPLIGWFLVERMARRQQVQVSAAPGRDHQQQLDQQLATWQQQVMAWEQQQAQRHAPGPGTV
ncbi:lysostaphin resistance A-like protein [Luteococcus sp. Sow4_B9]|uniref:CPBP family intramembrane glutamic endopeptidase n=1 Tax=Luteococcus sp. Sow4_B9 TaxID=3438792 RepID=UPI003F9867D9